MSTAKSREQYIRMWNNHIKGFSEMIKLFEEREDDVLYYELLAIRRRLKELVLVSADLEFGDREMNYFVLDGIEGFVNSMGWIEWHTIGCHIESIRGCRLEQAAQQALDNAAVFPEPPAEKNYVL